MKISLGFDHRGVVLKNTIIECLNNLSVQYIDRGTISEKSVDYPDFAEKVAEDVKNDESQLGILVCNTGIGMAIAANKFKGIRAAYVINPFTAESARRHNDANILVLGAITIEKEEICKTIETFIKCNFDKGRHQRRIDKINEIENY